MRVARINETFSTSDTFRVWPITDTHLGAIDSDEDLLKSHISEIQKDKNARVIFLGDVGDLIDWRDKRFQAGMWPQRYLDAMNAEGGIPSETVAHAIELFQPIRKQIWCWLSGNHEYTIRSRYDREIGSEIAAQLGVEYLGYGGFLRVQWKNKTSGAKGAEHVTVFDLHHGWQGGRTAGAKVNQLEKHLGESDADVVLRGHSHDRVAHIFPSLRIMPQTVRDWERVVAHCGSYKLGRVDTVRGEETHDTWEARRGFRRKTEAVMGPPIIEMDFNRAPRPSENRSRSGRAGVQYRVIL
jgi:UDP-2,3-diacylglucosamine pyrophosphatase LpxH